ncbi:polyketide synthase, partial [Salmonella enterica]|nr:polyketide synthase [Salmonella enterica]
QSIRAGQCEVALAGGVSLTLPTRSGHLYQEGAMLSRDGHCRPFDAAATGTVFSDGAAVVVLKDLAAAQRDGDRVLAVLKGVGVSNDGGGKGSFTAPSTEGQAAAIGQALREAQVPAATIGYVEAHGTGTPLGDPIELAGLRLAFGPDAPRQACALGSVKSNLGHLTHAAGVTGLIKAVLALHHRQLPPSLGFAQPNPHLALETSPFYVNTELRD